MCNCEKSVYKWPAKSQEIYYICFGLENRYAFKFCFRILVSMSVGMLFSAADCF